MFCPSCGKEMPDGAKFCGNCGNSVNSPATFGALEVVDPPFVKWRLISGVISGALGAFPLLFGVLTVSSGAYGAFLGMLVCGGFLLLAGVISVITRESTSVVVPAMLPVFYAVAAVAGHFAHLVFQPAWAIICAIMSIVVLVKIIRLDDARETDNKNVL